MADRVVAARKAPAGDVCAKGIAKRIGAPAQAGAQVGDGETERPPSREDGVSVETVIGDALSAALGIAVDVASGGTGAVAPAHPPAPSRKREGEKKKKPASSRGRRKPKAKRRMVRWSAAREAVFLQTLGETGNVTQAVRESGLSDTNVRRYRLKSEEFRAKWAVALREGYAKLEMLMLERALAGVEKPVWHGGKQVGTQRVYDNATCLRLLALHRDTVNGTRPMAVATSEEAARAAVAARLSEMNRNMGGAG